MGIAKAFVRKPDRFVMTFVDFIFGLDRAHCSEIGQMFNANAQS